MADYCTLSTVKTRLGITDTTDDVGLSATISAVSRAIEAMVGRKFYSASATRYYEATHASYLDVDDLLSITTLSTDEDANGTWEVTWTADTDYLLLPINAVADGVPYNRIEVSPLSRYYFPVDGNPRNTKIVGTWGYSEYVPDNVEEAAILATIQGWKRNSMPFGVMGPSGFNQTLRQVLMQDPTIRAYLAPYMRLT